MSEVQCARCGKTVEARGSNTKYCLECIAIIDSERYKTRNRKQKRTTVAKPSGNMAEIAKRAREAKMTYGQYVATIGR